GVNCHSGDLRLSKVDRISVFINGILPLRSKMTKESCEIQNSYPLYSLINGFTIEKDGEYDIYFFPQRYVLPGLLVSGASLVLVTFILLSLRKRSSKCSLGINT
ncbi:hypothetical protein KKB40_03180, partial [Patescibacteria group bacterium]|nr:hypothetical protein [Patescibacteria group bacterium]